MPRIHVLVFLLLLAAWSSGLAQQGDHEGERQPETWRDFEVPEAPPLSPDAALESFRIAPGFVIELVASEPLVEDPVVLRFDERGRLFVVEMRGVMPNVDGEGEDQPLGRVVVLEDLDHDGRMDRSTVFLDGLVLPWTVKELNYLGQPIRGRPQPVDPGNDPPWIELFDGQTLDPPGRRGELLGGGGPNHRLDRSALAQHLPLYRATLR